MMRSESRSSGCVGALARAALLLSFGLAVWPCGAAEVPLTFDWNGVVLDRPYPVTGGIPFARGALPDATAVRLMAGSQELALQTEVLAWWPDHSVKWLLLDFQASPAQTNAVLEYAGNTRRRAVARAAITAATGGGAVTVDTGVLRFVVRTNGCGFLDEAAYAGRPVFEASGRRLNFMDAVHVASPSNSPPMERGLVGGEPDPSQVTIRSVTLEKSGPLHAVVLIDGAYRYRRMGSTIQGTDVKGDCPFRLRLHAYAGQGFLKVEHFFYYEGDGDHDFVRALGLKLPLPAGEAKIRYIGDAIMAASGPLAGLHQQTAGTYQLWNSDGRSLSVAATGRRFEGVMDVTGAQIGLAVGVRQFWQNAAKSLQADLRAGEASVYLWPPESPPLDFRRHAREWSVGECYEPDDPQATTPDPFAQENYRLASKGVGKTHYVFAAFHDARTPASELLAQYRLFEHRPLVWAPPKYYADSLALGRYREAVPGQHTEVESALERPIRFWEVSRDTFSWYGFWLYGNLGQTFNVYLQSGRFDTDFGRWGWTNGDSLGRLAYALTLQAVRHCRRSDLEFAESYLYSVHDVCSTHTPAYPEQFTANFVYVKGAAHRHGAWPWACTYVGARGAHPVGAKIYYYLTGEGHVRDTLQELTELALRNPNGGAGDGPLGPNAQIFLYQWEHTGDEIWRQRLKAELDGNKGLKTVASGWGVMMDAAFGIYNALEEYMELTGDRSMKDLASDFADRAMPAKMKKDWTKFGYYRVYAAAYNLTRDPKYADAIRDMLPVFVNNADQSVDAKLPEKDWPGPAGGPSFPVDGNIIRDLPFALYALDAADAAAAHAKEGSAP